MEKPINFSGICFEVGQTKRGLINSSQLARQYFPILESKGFNIIDHGDCEVQDFISPIKIYSENDLENIDIEIYHKAFLKTQRLLKTKIPLINWGGDHSISISTVAGFLNQNPDGYVLWIDAHADLNIPEESLSGNLHGMPISILMNLNNLASKKFPWIKNFLDPSRIIYLGLRDLDTFEIEILKDLRIKSYSTKDLIERGMLNIAREILSYVNNKPVHISFDIDSMDPRLAPSTGLPVKNGLSNFDLIILANFIFNQIHIVSVDIAEVNPELGNSKQIHQTYETAFHFLKAVFVQNYQGEYHESISARVQRSYNSKMEWGL